MSPNDILEELRQHYLSSFPAHLDEMENLVIKMEKDIDFKENFDALYRKVHSLKGSGGTYGFSIVSSICHQLEDFLTDEINTSENIDQTKINTIFGHIDILKDAYDLLIEERTNFSEVEKALHKIKQHKQNPTLQVLFIGSLNDMYGQICGQILGNKGIPCSVTRTVPAIERLRHERFDLLITSQENKALSGVALIAAIKLNNNNRNMKYILMTSNPKLNIPIELEPDYIIMKNADFSEKLSQAIEIINSEA